MNLPTLLRLLPDSARSAVDAVAEVLQGAEVGPPDVEPAAWDRLSALGRPYGHPAALLAALHVVGRLSTEALQAGSAVDVIRRAADGDQQTECAILGAYILYLLRSLGGDMELTAAMRTLGAIRGAETQTRRLYASASGPVAAELRMALAELERAAHRVGVVVEDARDG